ncbi:proton-coupled amino acid transporter 1-like isoform X1 [Patiria miniata]|uniref:Amino acid transporter transmembrane domain-containing protein n=1 Tax=Patiria miniata TaxID=46514 RepID=A0A914AN90_PATMI|nr:proton-coupled amino acid transporter 1-like isoform X1 [Patiria miniata]XP_038064966.1 proton-coupled amino acid transporter 1-like isoform X1 [Patiria miniata]
MARKLKRCLNILMDFANLFKAFIGVNYLSIAFAIGQSGIALGIIGLLLIAVATVHGCHLLIKCKRQVIQNIVRANFPIGSQSTDDDDGAHKRGLLCNIMEKQLSYGDIAFMILGKFGTILVNFSLVVTQFGFCVNYFIFLGNTFEKMFPYYLPSIDILESNSTTEVHVPSYDAFADEIQHLDDIHYASNSSPAAYIWPVSLVSRSPGYNIVVLIPLPLFILFGYLRSVRLLGPVSVIANISIFIGYVSMLSYLLTDFCVADSISWFKFDKLKTFPIFFGQVTGSYEGIGTIVPIESSMDGNHHLFAPLLYLTIVVFTFVLGSMGFIGYLHLGDCTAQVLIWNLAPGSLLQLLVSLVVCIGVVFTFPLQCFPVIEVFEELVFIKGKCCSSKPVSVNSDAEEDTTEVGVASSSQDDVGELQQLLQDPEVTNILEKLPVATQVPQSVSAWKRNILRTTIVVAQLGCAYAFKDQFAYFSALTGAIGSTLLAFVIPALLHIKLKRQELGSFIIIKDVMLIIFGIVGGVSGVYASVLSIIQHTNTPCSASC